MGKTAVLREVDGTALRGPSGVDLLGASAPTAPTGVMRCYAAERWAGVVAVVARSPNDLRTTGEWASAAGVSVGALREICRLAGLRTKASLDFARMLRVILIGQTVTWEPENLLNVSERRTLMRLLHTAGLPARADEPPPPIEFVHSQGWVRRPACLHALRTLLALESPTRAADGGGAARQATAGGAR